jgi:molecular chaperone GrpE
MPKKKLNINEIAEQLAKEVAELNEQLVRERADAMNIRRRAEDEKAKLGGFYKSLVVRELLPFIDNLERALVHEPKAESTEWSEWYKGIVNVKKQLDDTLTKLNVQRIKTVGEKFDPTFHEAVTMEEGDGTEEIVSEELQAGYMVGDEVVRHAMVRVKLQ